MKWFINLHVKSKLLLSFAIAIFFAAILSFVAIFTVNSLDTSYSYLLDFPQKRLEYLMQVEKDCADTRRLATDITLNINNSGAVEDYWGQLEQSYNRIMENISQYIANNNADTVRAPAVISSNNEVMMGVKKQLESYKSYAESAVSFARSGDVEATNSAFLAGAPIMAGVADIVGDLVSNASDYIGDVSVANTNSKNSADLMFIILLIAIVVASLVIAIYIARQISRPLVLMNAFLNKVRSTGDMTLERIDQESIKKYAAMKDEIGQCVDSCSGLVFRLLHINESLGKVADGDLNVEIQLLSEKDSMGIAVNKMVESLNDMFSEIRAASSQVSSGADQVSQAAQSMASGSSQQAASVEEFTAAIADLQTKTNNNAGNSSLAREANNKTTQRLEDSICSMGEMLDAMKAIDESSGNITKVIKVIDDIAFQTNILALNAAVEAARAGQHGKGFAVVADEVRNLASKSAAAAKETATLIEGSSVRVKEGNQIVAKTNADLEAAAGNARESTMLIEQVAVESTEQARAIGEINLGIEQISIVVQANSAVAEESSATAEEMSAQAIMLNEIVSRFRLKQKGAANINAAEFQRNSMQSDAGGFALAAKS